MRALAAEHPAREADAMCPGHDSLPSSTPSSSRAGVPVQARPRAERARRRPGGDPGGRLHPRARSAGEPRSPGSSSARVASFPEGQTRLAIYENPFRVAWDGATAKIACWVRRISGEQFQVFAINCAHLGCPVRWFAQSRLFMCPCHGGVYYEDGSRASGPPPRGALRVRVPDPGRAALGARRPAPDPVAEPVCKIGEPQHRH